MQSAITLLKNERKTESEGTFNFRAISLSCRFALVWIRRRFLWEWYLIGGKYAVRAMGESDLNVAGAAIVYFESVSTRQRGVKQTTNLYRRVFKNSEVKYFDLEKMNF